MEWVGEASGHENKFPAKSNINSRNCWESGDFCGNYFDILNAKLLLKPAAVFGGLTGLCFKCCQEVFTACSWTISTLNGITAAC